MKKTLSTRLGRITSGEEPISNAEKQAAYRDRIRENDGGYSGTVLLVIPSGNAPLAMDVIREVHPDPSNREIVEMLLIKRTEEIKPGYFHLVT
ncbi:MAG: hypothetical protein ACYCXP_02160 [Leptospirillum sp.]|nr:hypothetical protein [Nitrospiraceae bacterium]